jgi:hypothetical protein
VLRHPRQSARRSQANKLIRAAFGVKTGAVFDGVYRYLLWREWDPGVPRLAFVMLNPSTADATSDDPTIRRCIGLARIWGYGALEVVNLFAYRATHPRELRKANHPVGSENDQYILDAARRVDKVVLAWGNHGAWRDRDKAVLGLLSGIENLCCLAVTQAGQPHHPLYVSNKVMPVPYEG